MDLSANTILDHKLVAAVNLIWAIYHIWIAITIEQDNVSWLWLSYSCWHSLLSYRASENRARNIFLVTGLLYLFPLVVGRHTYIDVK